MIRFLADECFNDNIVRGLLRKSSMDVVQARDVGLEKVADQIILEWAADNNRVVLSHDSHTMTMHAYDRIRQSLPMPGLIIVQAGIGIGAAINEITLIYELAVVEDLSDQVRYLPL